MKKAPSGRILIDSSDFFRSPIKKRLFGLVRPFVDWLLGIKRINEVYALTQSDSITREEFCSAVLHELGINFSLPEEEEVRKIREFQGPIVIVSNHPFGGIEGLMMQLVLSKIGRPYKIMANYLLKRMPEIADSFIAVDPFEGKNAAKKNAANLKEAMRWLNNGQILGVFPAGEVSTYKWKEWKVTDKEWDPTIPRLIQKTNAAVVPLYFHGKNDLFFQILAAIHPLLRTMLLVRCFNKPNTKTLEYKLGKIILPEKITQFNKPHKLNVYLKYKTYLLAHQITNPRVRLNRIKMLQYRPEGEEIIPPVDSELLYREIQALPTEKLLLDKNEMAVYCIYQSDAPNVLREIGRLREIAFRDSGEGSNKALDLDIFDTYYYHLFVWHKEKKEVVGGYRIAKVDELLNTFGKGGLYTFTLFKIKKQLFDEIGPCLEMGRSFVRKEYQRNFAPLMLLWMGIGHFVQDNPKYKYLFGPVSITADFHTASQSFLVSFLKINNIHTKLKDYVKSRNDFKAEKKIGSFKFLNTFSIKGLGDVQELINEIESRQMHVPVLLKHYLKLGGKLLAFNVDPDFSNVLDGLIIVDLTKTDPTMLKKYMTPEGFERFMEFHKKEEPDTLGSNKIEKN